MAVMLSVEAVPEDRNSLAGQGTIKVAGDV
jgi:hypothetical protein